MQLLLILALLAMGGKQDLLGTIGQLKPVLEDLGDENIKSAMSSVEQIGGLLNAVGGLNLGDIFGLSNANGGSNINGRNNDASNNFFNDSSQNDFSGYPLKPVCKIADKNITYALSQYFCEEA